MHTTTAPTSRLAAGLRAHGFAGRLVEPGDVRVGGGALLTELDEATQKHEHHGRPVAPSVRVTRTLRV